MLIGAKYLKSEKPVGKEYTFECKEDCVLGDVVKVGNAKAMVTKINIAEEVVAGFRDKVKIVEKMEEK